MYVMQKIIMYAEINQKWANHEVQISSILGLKGIVET